MTWLFIGHMFSFTISFRLYDRRAAERVRQQGCLIVAFTRHQLQKKSFQMTSKDSWVLSIHLTTLLKPPALPWFSDTKKLGLVLHCPLLKSIPLKQLKFPWTKHASRSFFCGASWRIANVLEVRHFPAVNLGCDYLPHVAVAICSGARSFSSQVFKAAGPVIK